MIENLEDIKTFLEESLSVKKIKSDLLGYLVEMNLMGADSKKSQVSAFNSSKLENENVILSSEDDVNIISYNISYRTNQNFFFNVKIAIGEFTPDEHFPDFFTVSKCLAELRYNFDFSLYDVGFFLTELNKE